MITLVRVRVPREVVSLTRMQSLTVQNDASQEEKDVKKVQHILEFQHVRETGEVVTFFTTQQTIHKRGFIDCKLCHIMKYRLT